MPTQPTDPPDSKMHLNTNIHAPPSANPSASDTPSYAPYPATAYSFPAPPPPPVPLPPIHTQVGPLPPLPLHSPQPLSAYSPVDGLQQFKQEQQYPFPNLAFSNNGSAPETFPTPTELLRNLNSADAKYPSGDGTSSDSSASARHPNGADASGLVDRRHRRRSVHHESLARQLNIAYVPTGSDSISSHDKKRYYLEALEQYVIFLHDQLRLVGVPPVPMDRVGSTRGMSSRSIRTMLVHMKNVSAKLNTELERHGHSNPLLNGTPPQTGSAQAIPTCSDGGVSINVGVNDPIIPVQHAGSNSNPSSNMHESVHTYRHAVPEAPVPTPPQSQSYNYS